MQRKMKLIRKLLKRAEMSQSEDAIPIPEFDDYSEAEVHYHVGLCHEAEYMVVYLPRAEEPGRRFQGIIRLTWAGHETLDSMRAG